MARNPNAGLDRVARVLPVEGAGKIFFVGDTSTAGYNDLVQLFGHRVGHQYATIDAAVSACTANRGDVVVVAANYAETVSAASGIDMDVAGVTVIGLGQGADRPVLTFSGTAATITMAAASCALKNVILTNSIDAVVSPIVVSAADCEIDVESRDATNLIEFTSVILTTAAADNLKVKLKHRGFTGGSGNTNAVRLVGVDGARVDIDYFGLAGTAVVEFHTTACSDVNVIGYMYNHGTTDFTKSVIDTVTGSTWYAAFHDGGAGQYVSGGSGEALAAGDLSSIASAIATIGGNVTTLKDAVTKGSGTAVDANKSLVDAIGSNGSTLSYGTGSILAANGTEYVISKTLVSSAVVQAGVDITTAAAGVFLVKDIYINTNATGLATGTNFKIENTNADGVALVFEETVAALGANATEALSTGSVAAQFGTVLENGAKLIAKSTVADCTGAGTITLNVVLQRITDGASVAPAA